MTVPRREIFDPGEVGVYHCMARCVRRAFLCGEDLASGRSFEHRREWTRGRLRFLCELFAIDLKAYAVMGNHLHTVLRNRPDIAASWSAEEVARRWRRLFPLRRENGSPAEPTQAEILAIATNPTLANRYRARLSNISWFQRCLCEYIARRANKEDECTGRFWEGRFKSQRVHGECGAIACMVYVDLNPIRSKSATSLETSDFTSIQDRIRAKRLGKPHTATPRLQVIESCTNGALSTDEYILLVRETARILSQEAPTATVGSTVRGLLNRFQIKHESWLHTISCLTTDFKRVVGPQPSLEAFASKIGKKWVHGYAAAEAAFIA